MSVDLGCMARMYFPGLLKASICDPQGWLMKLICLIAAPSVVCILFPETNWTNFGLSLCSYNIA
jgi:hypothetical protein